MSRLRVGLQATGRAPVRGGVELIDGSERVVGKVTSGGFGPTAGGPVAMGYVETALAEAGTELAALVRGKPVSVRVAKRNCSPLLAGSDRIPYNLNT